MRNRIFCGIQDNQLQLDLLKDPCLDLQRCLQFYRAAALSKERSIILEEGENANSLRDHMKRSKVFDNKRREKVDKRREIKESEGVKSRRTIGVKMKVLCTARTVKK